MSGNIRDAEMQSIHRLVSFLRLAGFPEIDDAQPIDGEAVGNGLPDACARPYIVEHTTIDGIQNLRSDNARFQSVVGGIEEDLKGKLGFCLRIAWEVGAIPTGHSWSEVGTRLRSWILADARNLADGIHNQFEINGVPFPLRVAKNTMPRFNGVYFARIATADRDWLAQELPRHLEAKMRKVTSYIATAKEYSGYNPLLFVESGDFALLDPQAVLKAFRSIGEGVSDPNLAAWFCHLIGEDEVTYLDLVSGQLFLFDQRSRSIVHETWITV